MYNYCTKEPYSFITIDARPTATVPFRKNFDESLINDIKLDDKIKCNINQYKIDRLNAEISAFSNGDLNKYKFLIRKDLKYKPNALDKAKFEFSPLGKAFSTGLDKTAEGYQEEGVIKLLKDIRDDLAGGANRPNRPNRPNDNDDNDDNVDNDDNGDNADNDDSDDRIENLKGKILDLEIELKDSKLSNEEKDKLYKKLNNNNKKLEEFIEIYDTMVNEDKKYIYNMSDKFKNNMENNINN